MKQRISILLLILAFAFGATAQTIGNFIDVLYLKNGSKIKGIIVEQIPGKTLKIRMQDGSEMIHNQSEIEKFTREESLESRTYIEKPDSLKFMNNFKRRGKSYFFKGEALLDFSGLGFRVTNGYRFSRRANLGFALGLENIDASITPIPVLSMHINFSGDILDTRITPFYQLEAGYGFSLNRHDFNSPFYEDQVPETYDFQINYGGPMAGLAFGVKFNTKRKVNYSLALDTRVTTNFSDNHLKVFNNSGELITAFSNSMELAGGVGIRFGVGF